MLTKSHLIYYKDSSESRILGLLPLQGVRNQFLKDEHPENPEYKFAIRFLKNFKSIELWLSDAPLFKVWMAKLSAVCIQTNFHGKFKALKIIGRGSFATVYLVENKETMQKYAVKAFHKE